MLYRCGGDTKYKKLYEQEVSSYNNLQSQYNSLQSSYNNLNAQYNSLQSSYNNLQNNYGYLSNGTINYKFLGNITAGFSLNINPLMMETFEWYTDNNKSYIKYINSSGNEVTLTLNPSIGRSGDIKLIASAYVSNCLTLFNPKRLKITYIYMDNTGGSNGYLYWI